MFIIMHHWRFNWEIMYLQSDCEGCLFILHNKPAPMFCCEDDYVNLWNLNQNSLTNLSRLKAFSLQISRKNIFPSNHYLGSI